jgi:hypothetical protein
MISGCLQDLANVEFLPKVNVTVGDYTDKNSKGPVR